jgi:hypothetical protein
VHINRRSPYPAGNSFPSPICLALFAGSPTPEFQTFLSVHQNPSKITTQGGHMSKLSNLPENKLVLRSTIAHNTIALLICILALACPALADSVTYDIGYNLANGTTTIFNFASSSTDLPFQTRLGSLAGQNLSLAPGDTVTIDSAGDVSGLFTVGGPVQCTNKKYHGGTFTVTVGFSGTITVNPGKADSVVYTFNGTDTATVSSNGESGSFTATNGTFPPIKLGDSDEGDVASTDNSANKVSSSVDAVITPTGGDAAFILQGPDWQGDPSQANVELLFGTLESVDDTSSFTSIFTENATTGCPEPSSIILLLTGISIAGFFLRFGHPTS